MSTKISLDMIDAIPVQFLKPLFEDDFVERGMKAWLTKIEWDEGADCYNLFFDFKDFEEENDKYFTECYRPNRHTESLPKSLCTQQKRLDVIGLSIQCTSILRLIGTMKDSSKTFFSICE